MEEYEKELESLIEDLIVELNEKCEGLKNWSYTDISLNFDKIKCKIVYKKYCNIDYFCCDDCTDAKGFLCVNCINIIENFRMKKLPKINRKRIKLLDFTEKNFNLLKNMYQSK